jgi:hypothetical protein
MTLLDLHQVLLCDQNAFAFLFMMEADNLGEDDNIQRESRDTELVIRGEI